MIENTFIGEHNPTGARCSQKPYLENIRATKVLFLEDVRARSCCCSFTCIVAAQYGEYAQMQFFFLW